MEVEAWAGWCLVDLCRWQQLNLAGSQQGHDRLLLLVEVHSRYHARVISTPVRSLRGFLPLLHWLSPETGALVEAWA